MTKEQLSAEFEYKLTVTILDTILANDLITEQTYDAARSAAAKEFHSLIGLLESKDMLWKKDK